MLVLVFEGCSSKPNWNDYKNGTHLIIEATRTSNKDTGSLKNTTQILRRRLHEYGVKNYLIRIEDKNRFSIQFPRKLRLSKQLYSLILKPYRLEFKLLNENYTIDDVLPENLPQDSEILYSADKYNEAKNTKIPYVVFKEALLENNFQLF
jgi:preprotein translocase subunit SecD